MLTTYKDSMVNNDQCVIYFCIVVEHNNRLHSTQEEQVLKYSDLNNQPKIETRTQDNWQISDPLINPRYVSV